MSTVYIENNRPDVLMVITNTYTNRVLKVCVLSLIVHDWHLSGQRILGL